jgi:hypothetical protein
MKAPFLKKILLFLLLIIVSVPLLIFALLTLYVYVDSTGILVSYDNYVFQKRLEAKVGSSQKEFLLKELTDFKWNKVCIYLPYGDNINSFIEDGFWSLSFEDTTNSRETKFKVNRGVVDYKWLPSSSNFCYSDEVRSIVFKENDRNYITFTN